MEIKGKVHCFFEQSGTFKNEFIKLGIPAEDYDIQNNFQKTDHVIDLFAEIEKGYNGKPSIFDNISKDDLIIAFFPSIYFCEKSQMAMTFDCINYRILNEKEKVDKIIKRSEDRQYFYQLLLKLFGIVYERELKMVVENPYSVFHYLSLSENFIVKPSVIDKDRTKRGDFFKKPTQYWFVGCKASKGMTYQPTPSKKIKKVAYCKPGLKSGLCSEERSLISPDYARNWICDFILGKSQPNICKTLFD